ncbi:four helix bundle protein [Eubacterium limosum]|nr:four helix bundle protein [Eubacterium limosum]
MEGGFYQLRMENWEWRITGANWQSQFDSDGLRSNGVRAMNDENPIVKKSFQFAVRVIRCYQYLCQAKKEFVLSKQLLRSGTSIGANIREAQEAQSRKDFLSKMSIALKEASETCYWLELLMATDYLTSDMAKSLYTDSVELRKMLASIVKSTKEKI